MKSYAPRGMMPNRNQLYTLTSGKLSEGCRNSIAWKAVEHLFGVPENLYKTLDYLTEERLSVFVNSGQYLSHSQEHDLVLLMATSVANTETQTILEIINKDITISDQDREILKTTVETFRETATATLRALGQIRWIS
jgi:hypothetical protein